MARSVPGWHFFCCLYLRPLFSRILGCLIKANNLKGWDAKPPACVARKRDTAAGLPGKRSTLEGVDYEKDGFGLCSLFSFCFCNSFRGTGW